jgi:DNA-binding transcriptional LysR family regulator
MAAAPGVPHRQRKLEEELGGLLLRREHLLTHLTDFGCLVRPHLEQMMAEAEAAKSTATHFLQMDNALINLGVMRTVGPIRFMSFLAEFRASHPGCEVTLTRGYPDTTPWRRSRAGPSRGWSPPSLAHLGVQVAGGAGEGT